MERLTEYIDHGIVLREEVDVRVITEKDFDNLQHILSKLAAYEDTGLTPEEIMDGKMLTGWIPVEERLPNQQEYQKNDGRFIATDRNRVYQGLFDVYDNKFVVVTGSGIWIEMKEDKCISAWMPLPEPYRREEKKEEPSEPCKSCPKAEWIDMYGKIVYGCDMSHCIADDGGRKS